MGRRWDGAPGPLEDVDLGSLLLFLSGISKVEVKVGLRFMDGPPFPLEAIFLTKLWNISRSLFFVTYRKPTRFQLCWTIPPPPGLTRSPVKILRDGAVIFHRVCTRETHPHPHPAPALSPIRLVTTTGGVAARRPLQPFQTHRRGPPPQRERTNPKMNWVNK